MISFMHGKMEIANRMKLRKYTLHRRDITFTLCPVLTCNTLHKVILKFQKDRQSKNPCYLYAIGISRYTILANQNGFFFSTWLCIFSRYIGLVIQIDGRELRRNQVENPLPRWRWWINMKLALWTYLCFHQYIDI